MTFILTKGAKNNVKTMLFEPTQKPGYHGTGSAIS
jgi:hypothetical protein